MGTVIFGLQRRHLSKPPSFSRLEWARTTYQALIIIKTAVTRNRIPKIVKASRAELMIIDCVSSNRVAAYTELIAGTRAARKTY